MRIVPHLLIDYLIKPTTEVQASRCKREWQEFTQ